MQVFLKLWHLRSTISLVKKAHFKSLDEQKLASYQTLQQGNNCSMHAIAAAITMLTGKSYDPDKLASYANRLWLRGRIYRIWPGWAVTPAMQAGFVNHLAQALNLPLKARLLHLSVEVLRNLLLDEKLVVIISIFWWKNKAPKIYLGQNLTNYNNNSQAGAHAMVLAAYDEGHFLQDGRLAPWGFINSWTDGGTALFWMTDPDFRRSWRFLPPVLGNNPAVVIHRSQETKKKE